MDHGHSNDEKEAKPSVAFLIGTEPRWRVSKSGTRVISILLMAPAWTKFNISIHVRPAVLPIIRCCTRVWRWRPIAPFTNRMLHLSPRTGIHQVSRVIIEKSTKIYKKRTKQSRNEASSFKDVNSPRDLRKCIDNLFMRCISPIVRRAYRFWTRSKVWRRLMSFPPSGLAS